MTPFRWAAKEAVIKASPKPLRLTDIVVLRAHDKTVYGVVLDKRASSNNEAADDESDALAPKGSCNRTLEIEKSLRGLSVAEANQKIHNFVDGYTVPLSISHDGDYAVATCIHHVDATVER